MDFAIGQKGETMTRKEAREYIIKHCNPHRDTSTQWDDAMECAIKALEEPERKTGKWIPVMNGRGRHCCNRCNGYAPSYKNGDENLSDFCPDCGADMRTKETDCDYERAVEQLEHNILYEPTFNQDDGSM